MRVSLAYPYTDDAGKRHDTDSTVDLPPGTANRLIELGRARPAPTEAPKPRPGPRKKAAAKKATAAQHTPAHPEPLSEPSVSTTSPTAGESEE
ncbi:MAG: hypothetical protein ABW143_09010 [Acidimicrobiales bacterium]